MELEEFKARLPNYIHETAGTGPEAGKAFLFMELVRNVFRPEQASTPHKLYPDLERHIKSEKTILNSLSMNSFG